MLDKPLDIPNHDLQQLIHGCVAGDRSCQRAIYDWYAPRMLMLCLRYAEDGQKAEEILQDGFLQMYRHIGQYKSIGTFNSWLRRIMINAALMRYRRRASQPKVIALTPGQDFLAEREDFLARIGEQELIRLIQTLPPAYRMVFNLYVFEGLKHREIAHLLKISEGTSKSNLSDARALLRRAVTGDLKAAK